MSEVAAGSQTKESEILHYYYFRSTSVKLVKQEDMYIVTYKKYVLYLFKKVKRYEFKKYHEAEDKYLEIKSALQYEGRVS